MFSLHKPALITTNVIAQKQQITLVNKTVSEIQDYMFKNSTTHEK